jgi:hypothetical protein
MQEKKLSLQKSDKIVPMKPPSTPEEALAYMITAQSDLSLNMMAVLNEIAENMASIAVDISDLTACYKLVHTRSGDITDDDIEALEDEDGE